MFAAPIRAFSIAALALLFTPAIVHSIYQDDIDSIERFVGATNEATSDGMPYKVAPNRNHGVFVVAQSETLSNTCARERTECLRARVQKGMFGSEYVPPDDTARCQAAYRACLSGQQNAQPAPRSPTVTGGIQILEGDTVTNCTIAGGKMRCERSYALGISQWHWQFEGTISGSTAVGNDLTIEDVRYQDGCGYRLRWSYQVRYDFEDSERVRITKSQATTSVVSSNCPGRANPPPPHTFPASSGVATWRARQ